MSHSQKGGTFRLSGRKSIHNHGTDCPFWNSETMGRYGFKNNDRHAQGTCSISQEGTDEVDNIMSKLACAISPNMKRKTNDLRRNSFNLSNEQKQDYSDDSENDSKLLSKSSPAIFSSYSCCSDEAGGTSRSNYSNESTRSSPPQYRVNSSRTNNIHNEYKQVQEHLRRKNIDGTNVTQQSTVRGSNKLLQYSSIIIIVLLGIVAAYIYIPTSEPSKIISKNSFYDDVQSIGNKYKISENNVLQARTGISEIFKKQDTGSFIFAYNDGRQDFDLIKFNNFVNEITSAASRYLRSLNKNIKHVIVDTNNLQVQSDKELMDEYKEEVDRTGVMLVKDLDRVPSAVAMAFHYYCDEHNPLVKKSAIFFTLNMARCFSFNVSREKYFYDNIEKCLEEKWAKIPQDKLRPLLNRVVNVIIDVTNDF